MFNLIRCTHCGESKSIFRPLNTNKYLCIDCSNYFLKGRVAQLDKASVYGTEESGFESLRVHQNIMSKRYSGKSFKDSSIMKKAKLYVYEIYSFLNLYS